MTYTFAVPAADPATAAAHLLARLSVETDVSDVHADLSARTPGLVVVDSRGRPPGHRDTCRGRCTSPPPRSPPGLPG